ncbi:MAG: biopolymer transporter ExbD [Phycisphaerales bacterium]|nr:biopolymer transporter ExbD [Phycisphaerales bacterium]
MITDSATTEIDDDQEIPVPPLRGRRGRQRARMNVNLTSLIDVTFLLLIYFMVATSMTGREQVYHMDLPSREGAGPSDPFTLDDEPLRILVSSSADEAQPYRLTIDGPYPQPATFQALHDFLRSKQVNEATSGGLFDSKHPIMIEPAAGTRWEHAIEAFNAAVTARYSNVTFAAPG